ncbi:uncharacterized protein LOC113563475 [Ooceraea biroi]|uniref:uncharacterized protein LOC113563475 n=1 Tax=Ooceraea biroi TaxID=2015173 RepID=UPI000F091112|nr:uncharacterized protein LOC113563475 [Ooceraea biroi]
MYSAEGSSMNYYVPLQDAETPPKQCTSISVCDLSVLPTSRAVRILGRRYALTATGYKYLEIGINVGPPSYVEIVIGDHRGNELILSLQTWKGLYEQRWDIQNRLRKDVRGRSISVGPLTVRFSESPVCDTKLVCLDSSNVRLMMTESTFFTMINLDLCIELTYTQLDRVVEIVDTKFVQYSNITSAETKDASNAIRASECFNDNHIIDCELLALVFGKPMYTNIQ